MSRTVTKYLQRRATDLRRFCRAGSGETMVEFACIAPAFIALLVAILETTMFLFAQQTLQTAAVQAGRYFLTGQAQNGNMTAAQLVSDICPTIQALFNCNQVMVNVQSYEDFASANATEPTLTFNGQGQVSNTWSYSLGTPGEVMVVELIYQWPILGGPLGFMLPNLGNNNAEMMGVTAFRVEPY